MYSPQNYKTLNSHKFAIYINVLDFKNCLKIKSYNSTCSIKIFYSLYSQAVLKNKIEYKYAAFTSND